MPGIASNMNICKQRGRLFGINGSDRLNLNILERASRIEMDSLEMLYSKQLVFSWIEHLEAAIFKTELF